MAGKAKKVRTATDLTGLLANGYRLFAYTRKTGEAGFERARTFAWLERPDYEWYGEVTTEAFQEALAAGHIFESGVFMDEAGSSSNIPEYAATDSGRAMIDAAAEVTYG